MFRCTRPLLLLAGMVLSSFAATVPTNFADQLVASGLPSPTAMALAPDGRVFVCLQSGFLRVVKNGVLLPTPFLSLTVDSNGERGLLGIAFDPDFANNSFVYVYYTTPTPSVHNRVSRFTANGDVAQAGSEVVLLDLENLSSATNHNGGALHFGLDGKLYIAVGENANPSQAQSLTTKLGKILRMNKDGSIPTDNPFFASLTGNLRLIWAYGLRNPFTFAVQNTTGKLLINDVGQSTYEEINQGIAGANYGWPTSEGPTTNPAFTAPLFYYPHATNFGGGFSCAITGGDFYQPAQPVFPASYVGQYFFADYCGGWIAQFDPVSKTATGFLTGADSIIDIRSAADGSLLYLQRGAGGQLRRVVYTGLTQPQITTQPADQTVPVGFTATFQAAASGSNLTYQWQRNNVNIPNANAATYSLPNVALSDNNALFRVIATNSAGSATSNSAKLTVTTNQPPVPVISTPALGTTFAGGQTITFSGSASDPETGALPLSALKWRVDYYTGSAVRPFVQEFTGAAGGSWLVPAQTPYTLTDVFFRIILTAKDPQGFETTVTRDVAPQIGNLTLASQPAGLSLTLDGQPFTAPRTTPAVVGLIRELGAPASQQNGGARYLFKNWSDGQAAVHNIVTPAGNSNYTAMFQTQYQLTTVANPSQGGTVTGAGWYDAGSTVALTATPATGWKWNGWTGPNAFGTLLMDSTKTATANFVPAPGGQIAVAVVSKADGPGSSQRNWIVRFTNLGSGALSQVMLASAVVTVTGPGPIFLTTPLPLSIGNLAPGASVDVPLGLSWPITTPSSRARIVFSFLGDFGFASSVTLNNLFR